MKHGSLFSGIGGFDLAAEWMGWENLFHCEMNEFGRKVLSHYWSNAKSYKDVTTTDFREFRGKIDILTGGFPCQPYSQAGKRLGKEDDRHLWPEMLRAIREIQPRWVVGENVFGLINWNDGMVFDEVQADLEAEGYEVQPYVLPAVSVDAPHRRDRVWFVAHDNSKLWGAWRENSEQQPRHRKGVEADRVKRDVAYSNHTRADNGVRSNENGQAKNNGRERIAQPARFIRSTWQNFPTQPPICAGNDGFSERLYGITFPKWRNESIKAAGNAIVPQVALQIFKTIEQYENIGNL